MFVANFIGLPPMNLIPLKKQFADYFIEEAEVNLPTTIPPIDQCFLGIRPEDVKISQESGYPLTISFIENVGSDQYLHGEINQTKMIVRALPTIEFLIGETIFLDFPDNKCHYFDGESGQRLEEF